jgi:SAM-dependent methyltransferase
MMYRVVAGATRNRPWRTARGPGSHPLLYPSSRGRAALRTLIYGYPQTQLLRAAARLRLADLLADGPRDADELATRATVGPGILRRLLNGLAAIRVVAMDEHGRYTLTSLGYGLREDAPDSLATFAIHSGEEYFRSWLGLELNPRDTRTPFERVCGEPVFDWLAQHPEASDRFHRRMATRIQAFAPAVAAACDLSQARRIVDIGGGHGVLLATFLQRWPNASGVLFDLPGAAAAGEERLAAAGLGDRVDVVGGDFFRAGALPGGGDVYLLSQILHDWDDDRSMEILRNLRRTMDAASRLLIVEMLMPERVDGPHPAIDLDLVMLVLTGGRERTVKEYRQLLEGAGFRLDHVHAEIAPGGKSILEARPA